MTLHLLENLAPGLLTQIRAHIRGIQLAVSVSILTWIPVEIYYQAR
jgi:hypothetical protein